MIVIIVSRIHFIVVVVDKKNNLLLFHVAFDVTIYIHKHMYIYNII